MSGSSWACCRSWASASISTNAQPPATTEDLAYVSPKTGRAVSRTAAGPYKEKLMPLPGFLSTGGLPSDDDELRQGLDLTGYFLERHVFWPHNKPLPPARARFMEVAPTLE